MKRSMIYISVVMVSAAFIGSGCKKHRSSQQENSSISKTFSGQQDSTTAMNPPINNPQGTPDQAHTNSELQHGSTDHSATSGSGSTSGGTTGTNTPSTTAAGTPGGTTPNAPGSNTPQVVQAPEAPKEIPVTCFVESFKHKSTPGHDSEEACSHHKNLLKLSHSDINMKSVCVRVNDVPVKFDRIGHGSEFEIGSIAGPQSVITVKYCTGKTSCTDTKKNDCVVPKDEFLDAIGGGDPDDGAVAKWDNTDSAADAKLNSDVKRELADIDDTATDNHGANASVFKDWIAEKPAPACGAEKKSSS